MPQDKDSAVRPPRAAEAEPGLGREVAGLCRELLPRAVAPDWPLGWLFDRIEMLDGGRR
jgi:hypothetical protein